MSKIKQKCWKSPPRKRGYAFPPPLDPPVLYLLDIHAWNQVVLESRGHSVIKLFRYLLIHDFEGFCLWVSIVSPLQLLLSPPFPGVTGAYLTEDRVRALHSNLLNWRVK